MFVLLKRIINSGCLGIKRNKWLAVATVSIMTLTIFLITSLFVLKGIDDFLIKSLQEKVDISVYLKRDAQESDILNLKDNLEKFSEVKSVDYVSKEDALDGFIKRHRLDADILESLEEIGENPLLASLNIKASQASQYESIANFLEDNMVYQTLIDRINYHETKAVIDKIFALTSSINMAGIAFIFVLGFIAVLIAFNSIRIAIYSMREEISIMRLVGAGNWFIQGPFIVQGAILGGIATLISLLLSFVCIYFLSPKLEGLLTDFNLFGYFVKNLGLILFVQFLTGVGLGVVSSFIATRRYLNV